jgi:ammonia channel protein AmtB
MSAVFQQLGHASQRAVWLMIKTFLFGCPAMIFTYLGFARMTDPAEVIVVSFLCIVMTCLSWIAGYAMLLMMTDD